ncbi:hypothetical protein FH972_025935 [Carpinus fangiana]|uniref:AHC1-like C2H2 zinc-finger domain-containing protein n=1 Tax=Carpinus fangiana TaxID=176857 RepID=A0A5N6L2G2_9ROSI|nr:hypothetical protein FH972_025935 [Carpinus fangiana]
MLDSCVSVLAKGAATKSKIRVSTAPPVAIGLEQGLWPIVESGLVNCRPHTTKVSAAVILAKAAAAISLMRSWPKALRIARYGKHRLFTLQPELRIALEGASFKCHSFACWFAFAAAEPQITLCRCLLSTRLSIYMETDCIGRTSDTVQNDLQLSRLRDLSLTSKQCSLLLAGSDTFLWFPVTTHMHDYGIMLRAKCVLVGQYPFWQCRSTPIHHREREEEEVTYSGTCLGSIEPVKKKQAPNLQDELTNESTVKSTPGGRSKIVMGIGCFDRDMGIEAWRWISPGACGCGCRVGPGELRAIKLERPRRDDRAGKNCISDAGKARKERVMPLDLKAADVHSNAPEKEALRSINPLRLFLEIERCCGKPRIRHADGKSVGAGDGGVAGRCSGKEKYTDQPWQQAGRKAADTCDVAGCNFSRRPPAASKALRVAYGQAGASANLGWQALEAFAPACADPASSNVTVECTCDVSQTSALWPFAGPFGAHNPQHEKMACATPHPYSPVDSSLLQHLKRKRADSADPTTLSDEHPQLKKARDGAGTPALSSQIPASMPQMKQCAPPSTGLATPAESQNDVSTPSTIDASDCDRPVPGTTKINPSKLDRAQAKIESQINLEILYRHNELRLIDQEIAKVQAALEQIRRCQIVPYPGQPGSPVNAYGASTGAGSPLEPAPGYSRPQHPAAFGVIDSPYTRHYQQWLLPDPKFDSLPLEMLQTPTASHGYFAEGRSTRGFGERHSFAASRSQRHSTGSAHQALPTSYPAPRQQVGPLIIRRLSDQRMVKLVCVWCQKENISSVQGFLNHCRIAHQENFASHEQAAQKCGQPVDGDEASTPTTAHPPATTPTVSTPTAVNSPASALVHPLVTGNRPSHPASAPTSTASTPSRPSPLHATFPATKPVSRVRPQLNIPLGNPAAFVPSQQVPHLSALMKKMGAGQDMTKLVASAKMRIDLDEVQPLNSPDEESTPEIKSTTNAQRPSGSMAPPARTVAAQPSTKSTNTNVFKGVFVPSPINVGAPATTTPCDSASSGSPRSFASPGSPGEASMTSAGPELSPHDTNPGLVSDYDEESSESESEDNLAAGGRRRSLDVQVRAHGDSLDEQIVAGLAEEHDALTCAMQTPQPQHSNADPAPEPEQGQKRKRGRPSKADTRQKTNTG